MPSFQTDTSVAHYSSTKPVLKSGQGQDGTIPIQAYAAAQSIWTMDTYLLTKGYTEPTLLKMNKNDKIYALRLTTAGLEP